MDKSDIPDKWVKIGLLILAGLLWFFVGWAILKLFLNAPVEPQEALGQEIMPRADTLYLVEQSFLKAVNPPIQIKPQVLGVWSGDDFLDCLIFRESSGNPEAYNPKDIDGLSKFGLFQFRRETFEEWCVDKYGLENDIWNGKIQVKCAKKMIYENEQLKKWPPAQKCLDMSTLP